MQRALEGDLGIDAISSGNQMLSELCRFTDLLRQLRARVVEIGSYLDKQSFGSAENPVCAPSMRIHNLINDIDHTLGMYNTDQRILLTSRDTVSEFAFYLSYPLTCASCPQRSKSGMHHTFATIQSDFAE